MLQRRPGYPSPWHANFLCAGMVFWWKGIHSYEIHPAFETLQPTDTMELMSMCFQQSIKHPCWWACADHRRNNWSLQWWHCSLTDNFQQELKWWVYKARGGYPLLTGVPVTCAEMWIQAVLGPTASELLCVAHTTIINWWCPILMLRCLISTFYNAQSHATQPVYWCSALPISVHCCFYAIWSI